MDRKKKLIAAGAGAALALAGIGMTAAGAAGGDNDEPITGEALDRASRAALDFTGGGEVTETEVGDEESLYEVEVTLADGSQVDVQLDADFTVVGSEADDESEDESEDNDSD